MIVFYSDLDNTLIYSYRHEIGDDKICVEHYQDREMSFMTSRSYQLLEQIREQVLFVPTTTRTEEQYKRIRLGEQEPKYALVCNGGVLLVNGKREEEWYQESLRLIEDCREQLVRAVKILEQDEQVCFEIRMIQGLFVFTKSNDPEETAKKLTVVLEKSKVDIFKNGKKVYVVPKILNKGMALKRFQEKIQSEHTIAAGDSQFDVPMLNAASVGIAPEKLLQEMDMKDDVIVIRKEKQFAESLLLYIIEHQL